MLNTRSERYSYACTSLNLPEAHHHRGLTLVPPHAMAGAYRTHVPWPCPEYNKNKWSHTSPPHKTTCHRSRNDTKFPGSRITFTSAPPTPSLRRIWRASMISPIEVAAVGEPAPSSTKIVAPVKSDVARAWRARQSTCHLYESAEFARDLVTTCTVQGRKSGPEGNDSDTMITKS